MRQRSDYPTFSDAEIQRRHKTVYGLMEQEGVDALLFYGSGRYASDIYWLSDWPSSREAYLLMQVGREPVILMQLFNHYPMARVMSWIKDVRWAGANTTNSVVELITRARLGIKKDRPGRLDFLSRSTISFGKHIRRRRLSISAASCA